MQSRSWRFLRTLKVMLFFSLVKRKRAISKTAVDQLDVLPKAEATSDSQTEFAVCAITNLQAPSVYFTRTSTVSNQSSITVQQQWLVAVRTGAGSAYLRNQ